MGLHIKRVHHVASTMNEKYPHIEHIILKFQNNRDKERILKASKEEKTCVKGSESEWYQLSQQYCKLEGNLQNSGGKLFPPYLQIHNVFSFQLCQFLTQLN